jgi:hypothetical protein
MNTVGATVLMPFIETFREETEKEYVVGILLSIVLATR